MSSPDPDTPFPSAGVRLVVQAVAVGDDLGGEGVLDSELLALVQALNQGLVGVVEDRVQLALQASHLPYHRAYHRIFHLGCCPAYREVSLQVHHQGHSRLEGHQLYRA